MDQQFVYRVIGSVCRLESPPASRAPSGVVHGDAPLEYDLNLFPRRNLRCDLRRNDNLAIRCEFAPEVGGFHLCSLTFYIISRVRENGRAHTLRVLSSDSEGYVVNRKRGSLPPAGTAASRRVVVNFPALLLKETERLSAETGITRSELIRCAVEQYLEALNRKKLEQELAAGYVANSALDRRIAEEFSAVDYGTFY